GTHSNSAGPARGGFLRVLDEGAGSTELLLQIVSVARLCGRKPGKRFGRALPLTGSMHQRKTGHASPPGRVVRRPETNLPFVEGLTRCHTSDLWLAGKRRRRRDPRSMSLEVQFSGQVKPLLAICPQSLERFDLGA